MLAKEFFTTISLQLFNHLPSIICALIDNEEFNARNLNLNLITK